MHVHFLFEADGGPGRVFQKDLHWVRTCRLDMARCTARYPLWMRFAI